ncbi:hypothetical protein GALL_550500 [mine drainage metagenome]|uniref:Uncharacterized protein n=1 Tax=mine drainage metagenome TaxID=410659 RepID=A0A1J5NW19_9ZZZZ
MAAAHSGATLTSNGVDFINENDRRRILFSLCEKITDSGSADADEHFDEVRA